MTSAPRLGSVWTEVDDFHPCGRGRRLRRRRAGQTQPQEPKHDQPNRPWPQTCKSPGRGGALPSPRQLGTCPPPRRSLGSPDHAREGTDQRPKRIAHVPESAKQAVASIAVGIRCGQRSAAIGARGSQHLISQGMSQRIRALTQRVDDGLQSAPLHRSS